MRTLLQPTVRSDPRDQTAFGHVQVEFGTLETEEPIGGGVEAGPKLRKERVANFSAKNLLR